MINLAALAVAVGPAIAVAIARLRDRTLWVIVGAALTAIAIADISGMAKGEVERIWLPFTPWVLVASAALTRREEVTRVRSTIRAPQSGWLALQACTAIVVESVARTAW